jgi:hypothetical protein
MGAVAPISPPPESPTKKDVMRTSGFMLCTGFGGTVLAWSLGLLLALLISAALHRPELDANGWRTLSVSPKGGAYLICILGGVIVWLAIVAQPWVPAKTEGVTEWNPVLRAVAVSVGFGLAVGLLIGGIVLTFSPAPISSSADERRIIPVFPENAPQPLVAFTVFFSNGSALLSHEQAGALQSFLRPLAQCEGLEVTATGLVSSARYAVDNEPRNLKLASDRADTVVAFAKPQGVFVKKTPPWRDLPTMAASRVMDDGDGSKRNRSRESFNRQVSLRVNNIGSCGLTTKK